ncbi:MAG: radical SAM protein [Deltaproteobacteria bacterium]|nr:radical SAM protein [Deltaproteobacteria bacterium]
MNISGHWRAVIAPGEIGRRTLDLGRVLAARFSNRRYPLYVQFLMTERCALRCAYCEVPGMASEEMTTDAILAMFDELCRAGMRKLTLTGGDPLVRSDLPQIIHFVRERNVFCNIITTGHLLPRRIDEIRRLNLVVVSIDGSKDAHDRLRGAGSFDAAMEGIRTCVDAGIPVATNTVVTRHNMDRLGEALDLAERYRCMAMFSPVEIFHASIDRPENRAMELDAGEIDRLVEYLLDAKSRGRPVGHTRHALKLWRMKPTMSHCRWAGRLFCSILPSGRVASCNPLMGAGFSWQNGREIGYVNAMRRMPDFHCNGCYTGFPEVDRMLSLDPRAWFD